VPLRELLLAGAADAEIAERIRAALLAKGEHHRMDEGAAGLLPMIGTGG
jgi:hypothetical protein